MRLRRARRFALATCVLLGTMWLPGAASAQATGARAAAVQHAAFDPEIERRLLTLDPQRISESEVREMLAHAPAPCIIGLQGSVPIVTMAPFAEFLVAMGYPVERFGNPCAGLMPLLIGHSQGSMRVLKVLRDLAGASLERLPLWDPSGRPEAQRYARATALSPRTGS